MAGIGFELRKAVNDDSRKVNLSGYLGAAFSSSGSMIVAIILFCIIQGAAKLQNIGQYVSDSFMCYVTTAMFVSMIVVSFISLVISRYVSNCIYLGQFEFVMPSLIGSSVLISVIGGLLFSVMMIISKLSLQISAPLFFLFIFLCICWILMTYVSLLRDYKQVVIAFFLGFACSLITLICFYFSTGLNVPNMIIILAVSFGVIDIILFRGIYIQFSRQSGSIWTFLIELRCNKPLSLTGFLMMLGMLGHFGVVWYFSNLGVTVGTLFRFSSSYDFPAIVAYFSTIPTAIYFITFFETSFSESYQKYFYALGNGGSVSDINVKKNEMILTIHKGIKKITTIQFISCLLFITVGAKLLGVMNIGMTENMIDSFRVFCIGYSLYYIGNIFVLLQLYFSNEHKTVFASLIFAVGTLVSSFVQCKLQNPKWGLGFAIVSILLLVFSGLQLIQYLEKLEYNVLCNSSFITYSKSNIKNQKNKRKRLEIMITAGVLALLITIGSSSYMVVDTIRKNKIITFSPESSDDVLLSPGIGLAPWAESDETLELNTSLVYVELRWADWEPENDVFDIEFVKEYYNLETYREEGRQVVFRFICDNPTEEEHIDIPQWLFDETGGDGEFYDIEYGKGYSPNYSNELFINEHAQAIEELGKVFGQDDFFIYVELGSLGHWGEWHINYESGLSRMPEYAIREEYIKPYIKAFSNSQFLIRYPLIDATNYQLGLYNDMTGDYDETFYWLNQMCSGIWEQTELQEQADCSETWKSLPIGGEFASTYENDYFLIDEFDLTLEGIKASHQSFIGPKIIIDEDDKRYDSQMNELLKTIGYRYRVEQVSIDFGKKETFNITCNMTNDGIAPIYKKYNVKLDIYDDSDSVVWSSDEIDFDLRNLLPEEDKSFSLTVNKDIFDDDMKYTLAISITDSNDIASVPLALSNEIEKNTYSIAEFTIK